MEGFVMNYQIPKLPLPIELETKPVLKQLNQANRQLAELKGLVQTINESLLINTLALQEAKDSSEVENIVTTHDDLYKSDLEVADFVNSAATKEVMKYREAILKGFAFVRENRLVTCSIIKQVQEVLVGNAAGFRKVPGTALKDANGVTIYTPPQDARDIERYMEELEQYINSPDADDLDPLVKMAVVHHQFESIHPFYDGNGRTGRILSILFLVSQDLLNLPILYLSRFITHNKTEYYQRIQAVRDSQGNAAQWQEWILFMLRGIEETSRDTIVLIRRILNLMTEYEDELSKLFGKQYHQELLNNLFYHPYTKIEFVQKALNNVTRKTASGYLETIVDAGLFEKVKIGRSNYYINTKLVSILQNPQGKPQGTNEQ